MAISKRIYSVRLLCAAAILLGVASLNATSSNAAIVGDAAIDRANTDNFNNFVIGLPGEIIPSNGVIDSWNVFAGVAGDLALLILSGPGNAPTVEGVFQETASQGLNNFTLDTPFAVQANWFLGIWMDGGKVDFDNSSTGVTFSANGAHPNAPNIDDILTLNGNTSRDYSINASVVPIPAALPLFATALAAVGLIGYRRRKNVAA